VNLTARTAAALLALITWSGFLIQFSATYQLQGSIPSTLWILLWYFTIFTNLLVAIVFTTLAAKSSPAIHPSLVAATTLYILLVGIIYGLLLRGTLDLHGGEIISNTIFHVVIPILVPIFWLIFTPKGHLTRRDPLVWAIYPIAYLAYALLRGEFTQRYPYPFLNINTLGWPLTLLNAAVIAIAFLAAGYLVVWLDNLLGRRTTSPNSLHQSS
jgi:hypothetical protein